VLWILKRLTIKACGGQITVDDMTGGPHLPLLTVVFFGSMLNA
jgi:hypothetical protein